MSFTPHPVIPQSREQAAQRDAQHGLDIQPPATPEEQLARLRAAIRNHQTQIQAAGELGNAADFTQEQLDVITEHLAVKHAADTALWEHLN